MKSLLQVRSLILLVLLTFFVLPDKLISQEKNFVGTKLLKNGDKVAWQTFPKENTSKSESLDDHLYGLKSSADIERYVMDGNVLWWTDDQGTAAIANTTVLNGAGDVAVTGWGLNQMRVSRYNDVNNIPVWEFSTLPYDAHVDISEYNHFVGAAAGPNYYVFDTTGTQLFNFLLPDSLYASFTGISRDGSLAVFLASPFGNSNTARAYLVNLTGSPVITQTFDVPSSEIINWTGVNFSADGSKIVINGRNHMYVLNSSDFSLIWDGVLDNTQAPAAISGNGDVIVTADNSGFVQTWLYDNVNIQYNLFWQYRVPVGLFTNWASSIDVSADGNTIIAGTLIFLSSGYAGSVIAFDTYGGGIPKWIYGGAGDLVSDIAISNDGKVVAVSTWGDLSHTGPDLLVFDVATGELTFDIITPGSFFSCDISPDGQRVFAGGKAVHAREFGNGGRIYLAEIDLGGGHVSGTVDLTDSGDDSGVLVKALGTERSAVTDVSGNYTIQNIPAGTYTISAEKPGYNFGEAVNVVVNEGATTSGVNFSLAPFGIIPPGLGASTDLVGAIFLSWESLFENPLREQEIARMIGDDLSRVDFSEIPTQSVISGSNNNKILSEFSTIGTDSFAVYRALITGGPYEWIASVPSSQTSYTDSNVVALRDYYYVISIFNEIGQSEYSNEAHGRVSDTLLTFSFDAPEASIPTIDGILSPGEWDDAFKLDVSDIFGYGDGTPKPQGSAYMYFKFDETTKMLYVGGEDFLNLTLNDNEGFGLYIDDNNNDVFDNNLPYIQEGNFWAYWHPSGADLRFRDLTTFAITTLAGAQVAFTDGSGHLQGEVAIPMGFFQGYELQVFAPEKTPGLGAFIIGRQPDNSSIFNGWWPQTMNSVFSPRYFGDIGIDVTLDAPPQPPSDIAVSMQGNNLVVNWTDPALGLNNEPLPVPPSINIYKNGEFLTTVSAGVESIIDTDVVCTGWYEYQLEASIQVGPDSLTSPVSNPVGNYACEEPVLTSINYDDGEWDGFYVVDFTWDDNKFAVRFTPQSYPATVRRIETLVNGNDDFNFTVQEDRQGLPGDTLAGPYAVASTDAATVSTVTKNLPGIDPPAITAGDFWVVINWYPDSPGAPGIGVDSDPPNNNRGMYYLTSTGWQNATFGNIMITAYTSGAPIPVELTSFTASVVNKNVELKWETATEINNSGFEVQRKNKDNVFEKVAFIAGHGTTTEKQSYTYTDKPEMKGNISYRLKQIDFNGTVSYSSVIEIVLNIPREFSLKQNYPNPFNPTTIISYELPEIETVSLEIFNHIGEKVKTMVNQTQEAGYYSVEWNGKNNLGNPVSSGMYIYRINAGNFVKVHKMMLLR